MMSRSSLSDGMPNRHCCLYHQRRIIRKTGSGRQTIATGASSDAAVKVTDSTAVLYIDPVVMNNTTVGLATGGDHLGYHKRHSPTMAKTIGEGGLEPAVMNFL